MRLYAVALITWAATVIASSESNVANLNDEQAVGYTEFRGLPTKQIVQPYVTRGIETRNSGRTDTVDDRPDDAGSDVGLSRSVSRVEEESNGVLTAGTSSSGLIYATPLIETNDKYSFRGHQGDEPGYSVPEDVLLIENAGSFGQRVRQGLPVDRASARTTVGTAEGREEVEYASSRQSFSSTASAPQDGGGHRKVHVSTQEPYVLALKVGNDSPDDSPSDDSEANGSKTSSTESPSGETNVVSIRENDVVPEYLPRPQARSSRTHNDTEDVAKKPTERPIKNAENVATSKPAEIRPLQLTRFSGPIVVPDLSDRGSRGVAFDYTDGNDASLGELESVENVGPSSRTDAGSAKAASSDITISSIMLKPLQVGITLMNADEAGLLGDGEQFAATETKDYLQDDPRRSEDVNEEPAGNKGNRTNVDYRNENFQRAEEERRATEAVTQKVPGNTVEIQKSIELYHTSPVQEIHYPVEYVRQTSNLGVVETNNIGSVQRSKYGQSQRSESRTNYDPYRGNDIVEKSVVKAHHASAFSPKHNRQEYNNALEANIGDPMASALVAEYTSSGQEAQAPYENLEQQPQLRYNDVKPILLVANQYDDALYEQSNALRHTLNGNDVPSHAKPVGDVATRQEVTSVFVKPYVSSVYQEQQPPSNHQLIDPQHSFRSPSETRRPEATQLLLKIIPDGSPAESGFLVPIQRPYPIERIIEKTVHVPHPIEIEKVIEKKVPVPVPQPFPVHVPVDRLVEKQIRVPHPYPVHVERVVEKRVPYMVQQRLLVQPPLYHPTHVRLPAAYSAHVPTPIDKAKEKPATLSRPSRPSYRGDAERPVDVTAGTILEAKFSKYHPRSREPVYVGSPESVDHHLRGGGGGGGGGGGVVVVHEPQLGQLANASQFYADPYGRLTAYDYNAETINNGYVPATHLSNVRLLILPRKLAGHHHVMLRPHTTAPPYAYDLPVSFRHRQIVYNLVEKDQSLKDEYVGPVPPRKTFTTQTKTSLPSAKQPLFSTLSATQPPSATTAVLRRPRQPEKRYTGSFRQSKMEYGFKPPMVPSVQYDEDTASKVEI